MFCILFSPQFPFGDGTQFSLPYISMHVIGWVENKRTNDRNFN